MASFEHLKAVLKLNMYDGFQTLFAQVVDKRCCLLCAVTLKPFPPTTVRMRPVVSIQPWSNSDQNVGNLLMVSFLYLRRDVYISNCVNHVLLEVGGLHG